MRKLGIMGGTFDPIHRGHLDVARIAQAHVPLARILFVPAGNPPHKQGGQLADKADRFNMVALAVEQVPGFEASRVEVERAGATYTVDTLRALRAAQPNETLYLIVGGDTLPQIESWHQPAQLAALCRLLVVPRPGLSRDALIAQMARLRAQIGLAGEVTEAGGPAISSSDIRAALREGRHPQDMLPAPVWRYIADHELYGAPASEVSRRLRATMSEARFAHTRSVAQTAVRLAARHGVSPAHAHLAGMLHDCAKGMDAQALRGLIKHGGISVDEEEMSMPALLHAPAGVQVARTRYHVTNADVLAAIRWHTTGRRNMTALEKVIYLADLIEPLRPPCPGLDALRAIAERDLDEAVLRAARDCARYIARRGKRLHPRTMELAKPPLHQDDTEEESHL